MTRVLEVRRHSLTKKGDERGKGSHLSAAGVALARDIGNSVGPFHRVLTSTIPRTLETALAMGFAVDELLAVLGEIPRAVWDEIGHQERWAWENPFERFSEIIRANGPTADLGRKQSAAWTEALESVSEGARVLIVSHGRVMEAGLVTCFAQADFAKWGTPFHHAEGFRMHYDAGCFYDVEILRVRPVPDSGSAA